MKLAYLLNTYPQTSTTFIRREIRGIEAEGEPVTRFAIRRWDKTLVEPTDVEEQAKTEYLLSGNVAGLLVSLLLALATNLPRLIGVLPLWWQVRTAAGDGGVRHIAALLEAIHFVRRARALGITHVHAHFSTNATTVAMLARRMGGPAYSFTVHGPEELDHPPSNAIAPKTAHAAMVVAITSFCRSQLWRWTGVEHWDKVRIVGCGADFAALEASRVEPLPGYDFCCIARLAEQKGLPVLVHAFDLLAQRGIRPRIALIGDGDLRPMLEREIARLGLGEQISLLGSRNGATVAAQLRAAKAMVLPSFAEGLPVVIMESLAVGTPVVTTAIAGVPELVDASCGWVVPAGSAEHLADAMVEALAVDPERRAAMGAEGRRRALAGYDVRRNAARLLAYLRACEGAAA